MLFRPKRTVTTPSGDFWELYVTKTRMPEREQGGAYDDDFGLFGGSVGLLATVLSVLVEALWALFRALAILPFAFIKGRRSNVVTVIAISEWPKRQELRWTTTDERVDEVLDSLVSSFREGKVAQPNAAVFSARTPAS
jgi:hypothetical protein